MALLSGLTLAAQAQTPTYRLTPTSTANDFFLLAQSQGRHNQTLYPPGTFGQLASTTQYISTLYIAYGQNQAGQGNTTLDSLTIRLGMTDSLLLRKTPDNFIHFEADSRMHIVYSDSQLVVPEAGLGSWIVVPLDTVFPYEPNRSLILDIRFKTSSNTFFNTLADIRVNSQNRISTRRFTDTTGGLSEIIPVIGFDAAVTGSRQAVSKGSVWVYPNPSSEAVYFQVSSERVERPYRLLDAKGRTLREGTSAERNRIEGLTKGFYLLIVGEERRRIVVE